MNDQPYRTLDDFRSVIANDIPESLVLEYKRSAVFNDMDSICKTVTAFANSIGGHFLIGIEAKNGKPTRLDGGSIGPSKLDWIHKIINANTFPPVETLRVWELPEDGGNYYAIEVS